MEIESVVWKDVIISISAVFTAITVISAFVYKISTKFRNLIKSVFIKWSGADENIKRDEELRDAFSTQQTQCTAVMNEIKNELISIKSQLDNELIGIKEQLNDVYANLQRNDGAQINMLRNDIVAIYHKYVELKRFPVHAKELLCDLYKVYHDDFHENHYIEEIFEEMMHWDTYRYKN